MQEYSHYLHQAQVCMSLARGTDDPHLKQQYEKLAIDCLERLGGKPNPEVELASRIV
jgi:hypothetical protein